MATKGKHKNKLNYMYRNLTEHNKRSNR